MRSSSRRRIGGGPVEQQAAIEEPARAAAIDETVPVAVPEPSDKALQYGFKR